MEPESIDKIRTLIGYLEYFLKKRTSIENEADEIRGVVDEANEWLKELESSQDLIKQK